MLSDNSGLIKTFGLKIESFAADEKRPLPKKQFTIKPRTSIARNRMMQDQKTIRDEEFYSFSRELTRTNHNSRDKQNSFFSMKFRKNYDGEKSDKMIQKPLKYR